MLNGQNVNHVLECLVCDQVGSTRNDDFASSSHTSNSGSLGHAGGLDNRFAYPLNSASCRARIVSGDVFKDVTELICGR